MFQSIGWVSTFKVSCYVYGVAEVIATTFNFVFVIVESWVVNGRVSLFISGVGTGPLVTIIGSLLGWFPLDPKASEW